MEPVSVLDVFPHLLPEDDTYSCFSGYVEVKGNYFEMSIKLSTDDEVGKRTVPLKDSEITLLVCPRLYEVLLESKMVVKCLFQQSSSLTDFLIELKTLIEQLLSNSKFEYSKFLSPQYYETLISELSHSSIGWDRVTSLNLELNKVQIKVMDSGGRAHLLDITLHPEYPQVPPNVSTSVPQTFEPYWNSSQSTLSTLVDQFQSHIEKFQEVWDVLEDFDNNTCVIEPRNPTRTHTSRRIAIGKFVSLNVQISHKNPFAYPIHHFLGSESAIKPLRELLELNIRSWDPKKMPRENLENILKIKFLPPNTPEIGKLLEACGICYVYTLGDEIPGKVCDNSKCAKRYHESCLYSWLKSVQSQWSQTISNTLVIGKCPYCDQKISVNTL